MSQFDQSALARLLLGGIGQGAAIAQDRQRTAIDMARLAGQMRQSQRQEEQDAAAAAYYDALAQSLGLIGGPGGQPAPGQPAPLGPPAPGQPQFGAWPPPQSAMGIGGIDPAVFGAAPPDAQGRLVEHELAARRQNQAQDSMLQRQQEFERFRQQLEAESAQRAEAERIARRDSIVRNMRREGFDERTIAATVTQMGLIDEGFPAASQRDIVSTIMPSAPAPSVEFFAALGYPPEQAQHLAEAGIDAKTAMQYRPKEARSLMPDSDVDALLGDLVQSAPDLDPRGLAIVRLKMRLGEVVPASALEALLGTDDTKTLLPTMRWIAETHRRHYAAKLSALREMKGNLLTPPEDVAAFEEEVRRAEKSFLDAFAEVRKAAGGRGASPTGAAGPGVGEVVRDPSGFLVVGRVNGPVRVARASSQLEAMQAAAMALGGDPEDREQIVELAKRIWEASQ